MFLWFSYFSRIKLSVNSAKSKMNSLSVRSVVMDSNDDKTNICGMNIASDCPICMDAIDINKNCITTECGHCFHASCLMTNVARNGFGCPYCRAAMAEEPDDDEDSEDENDIWSDDSSDEGELYCDYALRGLRFMMNNLEGINHDILDIHDEREDEEEERRINEENQNTNNNIPNAAYVTEKLVSQGVTMEQLVKSLLFVNHDEYTYNYNYNENLDDVNNIIFGKMRIIISNYSPDDQPATPVPRPVEPVSAPIPSPTPAIAEPKTHNASIVATQSLVLQD
jgi:hypothetical protein